MRNAKNTLRGLLLLLCIPLSGCLFSVDSDHGVQYPIAADGSVDMTSAPFDDITGLRLRGFVLPPASAGDSGLECEQAGAYGPITGTAVLQVCSCILMAAPIQILVTCWQPIVIL